MGRRDDDIFEDIDDPKTAFNSALDIIQRISRMEYSLDSALLDDDLKTSFNLLVLIHCEIDFKMKPEEREEVEQFEDRLEEEVKLAEQMFTYEGNRYYKYPKLREDVKKKLIELKKVLGRLKYDKGLGMVDQSDPRFALLNG